MRHLIDPLDFTLEETTKVLDLADRIAESPEVYSHVADGKKIATLFYEPSTRTRLSFESAMLSLGGKSLGFAGAEQSSLLYRRQMRASPSPPAQPSPGRLPTSPFPRRISLRW